MNIIYKARVPTNIAFIKYWGKSDELLQWPTNDSLSMSLDLYSETLSSWEPLEESSGRYVFASDQEIASSEPFLHKGLRHVQFLARELGFSEPIYLSTYNEFPSSCGIASSASGLGSLTLAAIACWTRSPNWEALSEKGFSHERIAHLARLGSGSAGRSFWGGFVQWQRGETAQSQKLSPVLTADYWKLRDCIVILSDKEKSISSTRGHRLAQQSPLFSSRLAGLPKRLQDVQNALKARNIKILGPLLEAEATEMHLVMESSGCAYRTEATHDFLSFLQDMRTREQLSIFFTLDAGPNVHLIYEEQDRSRVQALLKDYRCIDSGISPGPTLVV